VEYLLPGNFGKKNLCSQIFIKSSSQQLPAHSLHGHRCDYNDNECQTINITVGIFVIETFLLLKTHADQMFHAVLINLYNGEDYRDEERELQRKKCSHGLKVEWVDFAATIMDRARSRLP